MMDFSTAVDASPTDTITVDAIEKMLASIPEDPLARWMREQGFDPEDGSTLVLPYSLKVDIGDYPPKYVLFSSTVDKPILLRGLTSKRPHQQPRAIYGMANPCGVIKLDGHVS